jgi:hypothetical protein
MPTDPECYNNGLSSSSLAHFMPSPPPLPKSIRSRKTNDKDKLTSTSARQPKPPILVSSHFRDHIVETKLFPSPERPPPEVPFRSVDNTNKTEDDGSYLEPLRRFEIRSTGLTPPTSSSAEANLIPLNSRIERGKDHTKDDTVIPSNQLGTTATNINLPQEHFYEAIVYS